MMIWNVAISLRNEQQMAHAENFRMIRNAWFDHSWFLVFNPTFNNISVIPWLSPEFKLNRNKLKLKLELRNTNV